MSRSFVTLAVLLIVHNEITFGHFHHPGHGPDFVHGPGQNHGFEHGPGHGPDSKHGPRHHPGFHLGPEHAPGHHSGFPHGLEHGPGHHPGFHYGPEHGPGHHPVFPHGPEHGRVRHELGVSEIRRKYAELLDILHNSCRNNSIVPKIVYSTTSYVIIYTLPETKDLKVSVTIQNQILATKVTGTGVYKGFSDVRILPDILKLSEAKWMFQGSDLKILIPYKVTLGTLFTAECIPRNGSIMEVPNPPLPKIYLRTSEK